MIYISYYHLHIPGRIPVYNDSITDAWLHTIINMLSNLNERRTLEMKCEKGPCFGRGHCAPEINSVQLHGSFVMVPLESVSSHDSTFTHAAKVRTRNYIISRLAGSTWGAQTSTLRTAALALCFQWQSIAHRSGAGVPTLTWSTSSWTRRWRRSREPCVPLHYRGSQS